jgi:hypothetical protein
MYKRVLCLGMIAVSLFYGAPAAQQSEISGLYVGERDRWQTDLVTLLGEDWYLRVTVGALANIQPGPFQPTGFARFHLGLRWSPNWILTPQVKVTRATHEIGIGLEGLGTKPHLLLEIKPFILDFAINPGETSSAQDKQPVEQSLVQPAQQATIDLKALVLSRLEDLLKASEQMAKENPALDPTSLRDPLTEFKKAFEANKMNDAAMQLDTVSVILLLLQKNGLVTRLQEAHLRAGLHRLVSAFALFREQVQRQTVKICTGLYISEDQKSEEVLSPLLTDVIKKLTFTNTKTGAKETFNLKESKCF